jgi:hypothetical protein
MSQRERLTYPQFIELLVTVQISFSTIFSSETFNAVINAQSSEHGILENIQKTLAPNIPLVFGSPPRNGSITPPDLEQPVRRERSNSGSKTSDEDIGVKINNLKVSSDKHNPLLSPPSAKASAKGATPMIKVC